jgi:cell division protein FtsN
MNKMVANKKTGASRQSPSPVGGSVKAYFAGLVSGLFIAFLVNLLDITPQQLLSRGADKGAEKTADKSAAKSTVGQGGTKFDFYTVLPEQEVVVAEENVAPAGTAAAPGSPEAVPPQGTTVPPPAIAEKPTEETPAPITNLSQPAENIDEIKKVAAAEAAVKSKSAIYLQAGSFRRLADADKRRAELLMYGMRASAEPVNSNGETWYRVQIGPFASDSEMTRARTKLKSNGIDTLMTRRK